MRTTCWDSSSASGRVSRCTHPPGARDRSCPPSPPRPTTTSASPCGTAGSRERARAELRRSVALDPAAGDSHAFLGTALRETGDLPGARASLQRAIALLPPTAAVYVDLGITYLAAGDLDKALGQLEAGLNLPAPASPRPDWESATDGPPQGAGRKAQTVPRRTTSWASCSAGRARRHRGGGRVPRGHSPPARLRRGPQQPRPRAHPDGRRRGGHRRAARGHAHRTRLRGRARQSRRGPHPDRRRRGRSGSSSSAVALAPGFVKARFNLAAAYGASPEHGTARRRSSSCARSIELAPTFARAHLALGKALLRDGNVPERDRGAPGSVAARARARRSPLSARPRAGARGARGRGGAGAPEGPRACGGGRAQPEGEPGPRGRARGAREQATWSRRRRSSAARSSSSPSRPRPSARSGSVLEKQGDAAGRHRRLPQGPGARSGEPLRETGPGQAHDERRLVRDDPRQVAELEGYIREGRFKEVEPLLAEYVKEHPTSSWGWYALGYSLFAQQKIGESIQALARSLELDVRNAEAHKILGRTLMIIGRFDDGAGRVRAGASGYKPDSAEIHYNLGKLLSMQDNWEPARKAFEAARPARPLLRRGARRPRLRARGPRRRRRARSRTTRRRSPLNEARAGPLRLAPREPERLLQPHRRPGRRRSSTRARRSSSIPSPIVPGSRRRGPRSAWGSLAEAVDALNQAISLNPRASSYYYVLSPGSIAVSARRTRAGEALDTFKRLERETSELEKKRRARVPRAAGRRGAGRMTRRNAGGDPSRRGFLRTAGGVGGAPLLIPRSGLAAAARDEPRCRRSSPTSPPPPASCTRETSPAARTTSSSCSRRWAAARPSSTTTTTAGSTSSWSTGRASTRGCGTRSPRATCSATTATARSPTSPRRPASPAPAGARPAASATTTTTASTTSSSPTGGGTSSTTTTATARSPTSPRRPESPGRRTAGAPAAASWTTTATVASTCSSRAT